MQMVLYVPTESLSHISEAPAKCQVGTVLGSLREGNLHPMVQRKRLRLTEDQRLALGHRARKKQSWEVFGFC